jgi:AraC family transcriptional activator of tynA and feaB
MGTLPGMSYGKAIQYDWSADDWGWLPDHGRRAPEHGPVPYQVCVSVTTAEVPPAERYDFWCETVYYNFAADARPKQAAAPFFGEGAAILDHGMEFYSFRSDAVSGARSLKQARADGRDGIDLGLVLSGQRRFRGADDTSSITGAGGFFLYDAAQASQVAWDANAGIHLSLRRHAVERALGHPVPSVTALAQALGQSRLAPQLRSQFIHLAGRMQDLDPGERGFLLHQTAELALYSLSRLRFAGSSGERERAALFTAAQRHIERHLTQVDLDANRLAAALGTSRATLYRAFADHGVTIAGVIRETRLQRLMRLLQTAPDGLPIARLAERCGLYDTPNVNQMFRKRFGLSPRDIRASRRQD